MIICSGRLQQSCPLYATPTARSTSTDIRVCTSALLPADACVTPSVARYVLVINQLWVSALAKHMCKRVRW